MGIYLNPGKQRFTEALNSQIYVDKTEMIAYLNSVVSTEQKYISVSRPRRFGKSMAINMLAAYYGRNADSLSLFEHRKLCLNASVSNTPKQSWDRYLGAFDVIRIIMTDFIKPGRTVSDAMALLSRRVLDELAEAYPDVSYDPDDFFFSLEKFSKNSGIPFVILIDEWDAIFRIRKDAREEQSAYLDFLRDWLKDREYIALAYITGILPIKKYGQHSALNMFDEYSMTAPMQLAPYTGFTEEEVADLCKIYHMQYEDIAAWYDGYLVSDQIPVDEREAYRSGHYSGHKISIYSPLSVVKAMTAGMIQNYWNKTETYEALAEYIRKNYKGLKEVVTLLMDGARVRVDITGYQNDMTTFHSKDDVLALLIHLGYLGYDMETREVFIPNREILDEFKTSTSFEEWTPAFHAFELSKELVEATWNCDEQKVADLLEYFHNQAENKTYNNEAALSYAIQYAYYAAQKYYTIIQEMDTGKGYADIVFLPSPKYPDKPALLVELKYNKDADTAFTQIQARKYPQRLEHYKNNLLLVSINYDKNVITKDPEYKHHTCIILRA